MKLFTRFLLAFGASLILTLVGCNGDSVEGPASRADVRVSWPETNHVTMNKPGSGYTVYYSPSAGVTPGGFAVKEVDVLYDPGTGTTPNQVVLKDLAEGTWYFRVRAFTTLTTPDGSEALVSAPSIETAFSVR